MVLLLIHAGATLAMVGLIWFVQVVHYPLFDFVSERRFARFAVEHQRRTSRVVVPLMLVEAGTALALVVDPPLGLGRAPLLLGVLLLMVIWLSTALLQVPQHRRLSSGRDGAAIRRLVSSNWLRTTAWTARGFLALAYVGVSWS